MPSLFLGHGAPPLLDDTTWMRQLRDWAKKLPRPKGILIVSAHWENAPISLSAVGGNTPLIYDFSGFDPKYYNILYPTPDASELSKAVRSVFPDNVQVHQHPSRGLDHGAWVPLLVMYPDGDIPVLQLSLPTHDPVTLMAIGERLQPLRDQGILIIGSGFLTHGLPYLRDWSPNAKPPGWSTDFDLWATEALQRGDLETLMNYRSQAPGVQYAHPTVEHLSPLFITLGTASNPDQAPSFVIDGYFYGLAKRSIQVA